MVRECYDEYFGIYQNSSQGNSPLALVALHEPEDLALADPFDRQLDRYLAANVLKYTGMDFKTFLQLPHYRAEVVLRRCDEISGKEDQAVNTLMNSVGQ